MELVYLWVEEYKNIEKQGFNFSPRFECKFYDEYETYTNENGEIQERLKDNCKLVICDKKKNETLDKDTKACKPCKENDFIENFFGDNINITAIVGKNGSGKSSLSEALILGLSKYTNDSSKVFIFSIFIENDIYYYNGTYKQTKLNCKKNLKEYQRNFILHSSNSLDSFSDLLCSNLQDNLGCDFIYDLETTPEQKNFFSFPDKSQGKIDLRKLYMISQKNMLDSIYQIPNNQLEQFFLKFNKTNISNIYFIPKKYILYFTFNQNFLQYIKEEKLKKLSKKYYLKIKTNHNSHMNLSLLYILIRFYEVFKLNDDNYITSIMHNDVFNIYKNFKKYIEKLKQEITEDNLAELNTYIQSFSQLFINKKALFDKVEFPKYFYDIIKTIDYLLYVGHHNNPEINKLLDIDNKTKDLLENLPYFIDVELFTINNNNNIISFNELCYGEKVIISLFYNLLEYIQNISRKEFEHLVIIFDEIENGLNPSWQKIFINFIIEVNQFIIHSDLFNIKSIHFIPITHSPFILSDLAIENVIFLKDGEQVKGIEKKQTFGANIHTLLSDSFFMDDGLMGEFAKGKINNVIKFLKNEKSDIKDKDEAKKIIEIIGEPFLKQKLEQLYYEQYPKSNDELIKEYEEKIKELKNADT